MPRNAPKPTRFVAVDRLIRAHPAEIIVRIAAIPIGVEQIQGAALRGTCRHGVVLVDDAVGAQLCEHIIFEVQHIAQDTHGVLADRRRIRLRTLGDPRHLHGIARNEHWLIDIIGARDLDQHCPSRYMRITNDVVGGVHRARSDAGAAQNVARLKTRLVGRPGIDGRANRVVEMGAPTFACREFWIGDPTGLAEGVRQAFELVFTTNLNDEPTVAGSKAVHDERCRPVSLEPHRVEIHHEICHGNHGVVHRDIHVLAVAGGVAVPQCGKYSDGCEQRSRDIAERSGWTNERWVVVNLLVRVQATHRLDDGRVRRPRVVLGRDRVAEP